MQQNNFLLLKICKNTESAQLWREVYIDTHYCELYGLIGKSAAVNIYLLKAQIK